MKNILSQLFVGIIGGLIVLVGIHLTKEDTHQLGLSDSAKAMAVNNYHHHNNNTTESVVKVPFDFVEASRRTTASVVHITAKADKIVTSQQPQSQDPFEFFFRGGGSPFDFGGPQQGTGSGVLVSEDGYIVTNNHVVEFADHLEVTLFNERTYIAEVVGTYPKADLAVIKIDAEDMPVLKWADSDKAQIGQWVLAVGNPLELNSTVTAGIISAKGRSINILREKGGDAIESFIQTDAVVNPGNSGGALVNTDGELLGINTAIKSGTGYYAGYSFAIPSNIVRKIVNDIIDYGSFQRAYLGIEISELDQEKAEELGIDFTRGVFIAKLTDGGSAQYSGLMAEDVIVKINDKDIKTVPQIQETIGRSRVGDVITVTVLRNGGYKNIDVKLKAG